MVRIILGRYPVPVLNFTITGSILVRLSNLTSQHLSFISSLLLALLLAFEMINIQFRTA